MAILMKTSRLPPLLLLFALFAGSAWAQSPAADLAVSNDATDQSPIVPSLPPSASGNPAQIAPAGGLLGYSQGASGNEVVLATIAHIRGVRVNHLIGHGLVVGLQN